MAESSDKSSDDNETESLAATIAKMKYTLSDEDDNDDNNDGGKFSNEDDWMEIRSSKE